MISLSLVQTEGVNPEDPLLAGACDSVSFGLDPPTHPWLPAQAGPESDWLVQLSPTSHVVSGRSEVRYKNISEKTGGPGGLAAPESRYQDGRQQGEF